MATGRFVAIVWCGAASSVGLASHETGAIVRRHDVADEALIGHGERFRGIATIAGDGNGTLIGDRWVLTAAHVVADLPPFRPSVEIDGREYPIEGVEFHPLGAVPPGEPPEVDLALVLLGEPVEGVVPWGIYRGSAEVGQTVWLVGTGDFGVAGRVEPTDARLRAGTNRVEDAGPVRLFFRFDEPPGGTEFECVSGPGDSGGPAFVEVDGSMLVAGVSSAATNGRPGHYGVREVYARVSTQAAWIDRTIAGGVATTLARPEVIDLQREGWPAMAVAPLASSWIEIMGRGRWEEMREFDEAHRPADFLANRPEDERERAFLERAQAWGTVRPVSAVQDANALWVLVETQRAGWRALRFAPTPRGKLEGVWIRSAGAP